MGTGLLNPARARAEPCTELPSCPCLSFPSLFVSSMCSEQNPVEHPPLYLLVPPSRPIFMSVLVVGDNVDDNAGDNVGDNMPPQLSPGG